MAGARCVIETFVNVGRYVCLTYAFSLHYILSGLIISVH